MLPTPRASKSGLLTRNNPIQQLYCTTSGQACQSVSVEVHFMGKRTNTAAWLPNQQRWQINVQKNGVRRSFTSSKPGRTGQREANAKADAWLDDGISNTRMLVEAAYPQWIGELKLTTSRSNWEPIQSRWNVWVRPVIGRRRVGDLTEQQLQAIINKGFAGGLSKKYLSNMCTDLTMFCK